MQGSRRLVRGTYPLVCRERGPTATSFRMMECVRRLAFVGAVFSVAIVLAVAVPWTTFAGHSHWSRVDWIPFVSRRPRLTDVVGNLALCIPLGLSLGLGFSRGVALAAAVTLALSLFVEALQIYSHERFPSMTDVVCNVAGAVAAATAARKFRVLVVPAHDERSGSRSIRNA